MFFGSLDHQGILGDVRRRPEEDKILQYILKITISQTVRIKNILGYLIENHTSDESAPLRHQVLIKNKTLK